MLNLKDRAEDGPDSSLCFQSLSPGSFHYSRFLSDQEDLSIPTPEGKKQTSIVRDLMISVQVTTAHRAINLTVDGPSQKLAWSGWFISPVVMYLGLDCTKQSLDSFLNAKQYPKNNASPSP